MDKAKKYNILFKIIIRQGKFLMLAFGIVCILIYTNYDGDNQALYNPVIWIRHLNM